VIALSKTFQSEIWPNTVFSWLPEDGGIFRSIAEAVPDDRACAAAFTRGANVTVEDVPAELRGQFDYKKLYAVVRISHDFYQLANGPEKDLFIGAISQECLQACELMGQQAAQEQSIEALQLLRCSALTRQNKPRAFISEEYDEMGIMLGVYYRTR
jgi:hypothetical protein